MHRRYASHARSGEIEDCVVNVNAVQTLRQRYLISRYSSIPYLEPSRPRPEALMPPNGATSLEIKPVLIPTMPYSRASATRNTRLNHGHRSTRPGRISVSLDMAMTSASSLKRNSGASGPKVSSLAAAALFDTLIRMVG